MNTIKRGEIWIVSFDPSVGAEIQKARPAVVLQVPGTARVACTIVVPITDWKPHFAFYPSMIHLLPTAQNSLKKASGVDASQIKALDNSRFRNRIGTLYPADMDEIVAAVNDCIDPPGP